MTLDGAYELRGPRRLVWDLLLDPEVLRQAMPGAQRLDRVAPDRYEGVLKVGLGPVTAAAFTLQVAVTDQVPPERFTLTIDSKSALGFTRGSAQVRLEDTASGGTLMTYTAELQLGGRIAGVGQRVVESAARMMTEQGLQSLQRALDERLERPKGPDA